MTKLVHIIVDRPYDEAADKPSDDLRVVVIVHGERPSDVLRLDGAAKRWPEGGVPSMNPYIFYGDVVELVTGVRPSLTSITVSKLGSGDLDKWEARQAKVVTV